MRDLDTSTTFLGELVGWSCGAGGDYLLWITGDITSTDGAEVVHAKVDQALADGQWTSVVAINLMAGWYAPAEGTGPATVRVTYKGVTQSKAIEPGSQGGCAATSVGIITVANDGTFILS